MPIVTVMYPSEGSTKFDETYYMERHMALVREHWGSMGLSDAKVMRGMPGPDGAPPTYRITTLLTFESMDQFRNAVAAHGREIMGDIANFTDGKPVMQFNEAVG